MHLLMQKIKKSPLFKASEKNHIETVKLLLAHGADIDDKCVDGKTPLFISCINSYKMVVKYSIEQKAVLRLREDDNIMLYDVAVYLGYTDICEILESQMEKLEKPKDLSVYEKYNKLKERRELSRSQQKYEQSCDTDLPLNNTNVVNLFLTFRGLINSKDNNGRTPLNRACNEGRSDIVEIAFNKQSNSIKRQIWTYWHAFSMYKGL